MKRRMPKDRTLTDMRRFFQSLNWKELWTEWFTELDPSGSLRYRTVGQFARAKSRNPVQKEFLQWYLGPKKDPDEWKDKYPFVTGPQDWIEKRESGGWVSDEELKKIAKQYGKIGQDALEAMKQVGNTLILNCMLRFDWLGKKLDEGLRGGLFLPNLSFAENVARIKLFFGLAAKINDEQVKLFKEGYAKAYGINFDDMQGVQALLTAASMSSQHVDKKSLTDEFFEQIMRMSVQKHVKFDMPLPDQMQQKVIDVGTKESEVPDKKKVQ